MPLKIPTDPLQAVQEVVVIVVVIVVLAFLWKYRERVVMALTGDTVIHITTLGVCWWTFFRCCGCCTGEWTRYLTRSICCCYCCCYKRLYSANLVREFGKILGLQTYSVEMKNLVVGDLPYSGNGDFYLSVECAANPPMMTSLQMESNPKVVHFPEVITLRLRNSILEDKVTITVKELNVFGSNDLCEIRLSATSIIDWASEGWTGKRQLQERVKRFEMKPLKRGIEEVTQAWILVEFDEPTDERGLSTWTYKPNTVRTMAENANGTQEACDYSMRDTKATYALINPNENQVDEPDEKDLERIQCARDCVACCFALFQFIAFFVASTYAITRLYFWSCYRQFKWITMASLNNETLPIPIHHLKEVVKKCHDKYRGTGHASGIPCRPNESQVVEVCQNEALYNFSIPNVAHQPRPTAFTALIHDVTGYSMRRGIPCFQGVCETRDLVAQYDKYCIPGCIGLILLTFLMRWFLNYMIRWLRSYLSREHNTRNRQFRDERKKKLATWLGGSGNSSQDTQKQAKAGRTGWLG